MDVCTINDEIQPDCSCAGTFQDSDGDGVCDAEDLCPGGPEPGTLCDDGDPNTIGETIQPDCSCGGGVAGGTTTCAKVTDDADDGEQFANSSANITSSDLELIEDNPGAQVVGMRFVGLNIPQGATIISAEIQFTVDETKNTNPCNIDFYGEDTDNAAAFAGSLNNISDRPLTSATVGWSPPDWTAVGDAGPDQLTPDLSAIVQEIVGRANYTPSSAIAIIADGTGRRVAESHNGSASKAPELCAYYIQSAPPLVGSNGGIQPWKRKDWLQV